MTWGWVNDFIFFFGWTIPLIGVVPLSTVQKGETSCFFLSSFSLKSLSLILELWLHMLRNLPTHFATWDISHCHIHCICAEGSAVIQSPDISDPLFPVKRAAGYNCVALSDTLPAFYICIAKQKFSCSQRRNKTLRKILNWAILFVPLFLTNTLLHFDKCDIINERMGLGHTVLLEKFKPTSFAWIPWVCVSG